MCSSACAPPPEARRAGGTARTAAVLGLALTLAACAAPPSAPRGAGQGSAASDAPAKAEQTARLPAPAETPPAPPAPPPPALPPIDADPAQLAGAAPARLLDLLGPPDLRRRDGPAEFWQYPAEDCVLDLFLYPGGDGAHRVSHWEARGRDGAAVSARTCLARLLTDRVAGTPKG